MKYRRRRMIRQLKGWGLPFTFRVKLAAMWCKHAYLMDILAAFEAAGWTLVVYEDGCCEADGDAYGVYVLHREGCIGIAIGYSCCGMEWIDRFAGPLPA